MPSVSYDFSVNQVVYAFGPNTGGILKGVVKKIDIQFTTAMSVPTIYYTITFDNPLATRQHKFDETQVYASLEDIGSPPVQGALSAYAATII